MHQHLVRVGAMGQVGRFASVDAIRYPRHSRVVVRTRRGLEIGQVLSHFSNGSPPGTSDGQLLRMMTVEDDLLAARLDKHRQQAYQACVRLLQESNSGAILIDVEHLFDGRGLYFFFLGDVPEEVEALTSKLADTYSASIEFRRFSDTLVEGCGPGCGTEEAKGQGGCDACTSCAVASACQPRG